MCDNDTLSIVRQMIADLLKIDIVDPDQDLFELGFHSLLAIQLLNRIEREHGIRLNIRDVFERPTARQLEHAMQRYLSEVNE